MNKQKSLTAKQIVVNFIYRKLRVTLNSTAIFKSHEFETDVFTYGLSIHGIRHTPSTYSRRWREIKANQSKYQLTIIDVSEKGDLESTWKISCSSTPLDLHQTVVQSPTNTTLQTF